MKKTLVNLLCRSVAWLVLGAGLFFLAGRAGAQTEGTLVATNPEREQELARIQDRVLERKYALEKLQAPSGALSRAKATTRDLLTNVQEGKLEDAARLYFEGVEAGVPAMLENAAKTLEDASRQAALDATSVVRWSSPPPASPTGGGDPAGVGLSGPASTMAKDVLEEVEAGRKVLQKDLDEYIGKIVNQYPELKLRMIEAGLTPTTIRDIARRSLGEADQLKYRAALFRVSAIVWANMATVVKTRALTGGRPQSLISNSPEEAIKAAATDKFIP